MNGLLKQRLRARALSATYFAPLIGGRSINSTVFSTDEKTRAEFRRVIKKRSSYATPVR